MGLIDPSLPPINAGSQEESGAKFACFWFAPHECIRFLNLRFIITFYDAYSSSLSFSVFFLVYFAFVGNQGRQRKKQGRRREEFNRATPLLVVSSTIEAGYFI